LSEGLPREGEESAGGEAKGLPEEPVEGVVGGFVARFGRGIIERFATTQI